MSEVGSTLSDECRRWDARYRDAHAFFGERPTPLLVDALERSALGDAPRALCLGEGEGRDALYLAQRGFQVTAVDGAQVGLDKLQARAAVAGVTVATVCADLTDFVPIGPVDLVCSFYCHLAPALRRQVFARVASALAPGGLFLLEGFATAQRLNGRTSGGPPDLTVLYEADALTHELAPLFADVAVQARTLTIDFGRHAGIADVVQVVARGRSAT